MSKVPTIAIELLRGGPPHNQLISPITEYLALCGDAAPHTLRLPFEHRDLGDRLRMLRYEKGIDPALRRAELHRLGRDIGAILGSVPSFAAELTGLRPDGDEVVHLRFVLTGNELALVPWECAHIPMGLPGAGLNLLLHPNAPVSLTREVRGASRRRFKWDQRPRILFATATEADFPTGTVQAHLLALMRGVEPWAYSQWKDNGWRIEYPIEVVENATIESIRGKCLERPFTHVHVLAHGAPLASDSNARFGLHLHDPKDPMRRSVVSGEQLALALRAGCGRPDSSDPIVVTLATCDSANQVSSIVPGGSVAHELHQSGIPWVIASQLPLTVTGSVVLAEDLYHHLLRGEDPRRSLHLVRSHLAVRFADRHDWASLVVYGSMHSAFATDVDAFRRNAAIARRDRAYVLGDLLVLGRILAELEATQRSDTLFARTVLKKREANEIATAEQARQAIDDAERAFRQALEATRGSDDHARHGAMLKRLAEQQWLEPQPGDDWRATLELARQAYIKGSELQNTLDHWAIGQRLVLDTLLGRDFRDAQGVQDIRWKVACHAVLMQIKNHSSDLEGDVADSRSDAAASRDSDATQRMWALSTKADLLMVAIANGLEMPDLKAKPGSQDVVETLKEMVQSGKGALWTTFRQFWRYTNWWKRDKWNDAAQAGYQFLFERVEADLCEREANQRKGQ